MSVSGQQTIATILAAEAQKLRAAEEMRRLPEQENSGAILAYVACAFSGFLIGCGLMAAIAWVRWPW